MFNHKRSWPLAIASILLAAGTATCLQAEKIAWQSDYGRASQQARQQGKTLLIHFWSESCGPCRKLDQYVFPHPDVVRVVNDVVPVKVNTREQRKLAQQFGIRRIPTDVLIAPDGRELWRGISPSTVNAYIGMVNRGVHLQKTAPDPTGLSQLADVARQRDPQFVGQMGYSPFQDSRNSSQDFRQSDPVAAASHTSQANPYGQHSSARDASRPRGLSDQIARGGSFQVGGGQFQTSPGSPSSPRNPTPPDHQARPATPASSEAAAVEPDKNQPQPSENPYFSAGTGTRERPSLPTPQAKPPQSKPPHVTQMAAAPKLGLEGYCPVTLLEERRWAKGDPRWGVVHRGQTFTFANEAKAKKFWTDPDSYSPMLSGFDPVKFAEGRQWVEGNRKFGVFYKQDRSSKTVIILFADEEALQRFWQSPEQYTGQVQQALRPNGQPQLR